MFLKSGHTILSSRTRNLFPLPTMRPRDCLLHKIIKLYGQQNGLNYYKHDLSSCDSRDVLIEGQSWWYLSTASSSSLRLGPPRCRADRVTELHRGGQWLCSQRLLMEEQDHCWANTDSFMAENPNLPSNSTPLELFKCQQTCKKSLCSTPNSKIQDAFSFSFKTGTDH